MIDVKTRVKEIHRVNQSVPLPKPLKIDYIHFAFGMVAGWFALEKQIGDFEVTVAEGAVFLRGKFVEFILHVFQLVVKETSKEGHSIVVMELWKVDFHSFPGSVDCIFGGFAFITSPVSRIIPSNQVVSECFLVIVNVELSE